MDKIAQRRGILNKLREMTNISGIAAEKFFNPQFEEVMDSLRTRDSNIRSIVSGKQLEGGDPGVDTTSMKQLLHSAKSNLNRREFMTAVALLGRFHKKLNEIRTEINELNTKVDAVHHQFLFQDLGDEHKQELESLRNRWAAERAEALRKEAGIRDSAIGDFFHNLTSDRGRALAFYEKRYPKQVGKLKKDTNTLLARSEALLGQILSSLKEMATARATRNVDSYVRAAEKMKRVFEGYDRNFQNYYNENVKGFLEKTELMAPTKKVPEKGLGNQEVGAPEAEEGASSSAPTAPGAGEESATPFDLINQKAPSTQVSPRTQVVPPGGPSGGPETPTEYPAEPFGMAPSFTPGVIPPAPRVPTNVGPNVPQRDTLPVGAPPEMEERHSTMPPPPPSVAQPRALPPMLSHSQFYASLEALSGESPLILATIIRKYAKSIQSTDPATAIQLLKIASNIGS
jgi:hypothetical protein